MTFARRTDANSKEIVQRLRELGCQVFDMQRAGKWLPGFPDLLVCFVAQMHLVEVKTLKGDFTKDQIDFRREWKGPPIYTIRTVIDAEAWVNRMRTHAFTGV